MRSVIASAAVTVMLLCPVAQAQNAPKGCDAECVQRLQQTILNLQQRVNALEQAKDDRLTTGSVGLPVVPVAPADTGPDLYNETFIRNPASLTPYISAIGCQHREQTGVVPSEGGGIQQITVNRC